MTWHRIVAIRQDGIGDMICLLPALRALRSAAPAAEITVIGSRLNAVLLEHEPSVDRVLAHDIGRGVLRRWPSGFAGAWRVRRCAPDLAIAFSAVTISHFIAGVSGATERVAFERPKFRRLLSTSVPQLPEGVEHEVDRNLRLLGYLGIAAVERVPKLVLSEEERHRAREWESANAPDRPLVIVHPGASKAVRRYPVALHAAAISRLSELVPDFQLVWVQAGAEGKVERSSVAAVCPDVLFFHGSLRSVAALFSRAAVVIANDSGPLHLAAAVDAPVVALFGPGDVERWRPRHGKAVVLTDPAFPGGGAGATVSSISPHAVADAAATLIRARANWANR